MTDWKEMYLNLMKDTARTLRCLKESQERCEELYLRSEGLLTSSARDGRAETNR
jgi:hypothetical protein